jgi:type IV pilus assembly protein PilM
MSLPQFIGVDIGSSSIRVAQAEYNGNGIPKITALGRSMLEDPIINYNNPATIGYLAKKISDTIHTMGLQTNKVVAALPEAMIFSKLAMVPNLSDDQIDQMLLYELKNHIPVNPNEVQCDYIYLGPDENNPKLIKILIIAVPKTLVEIFKSIITTAGLNLIALETETVALGRLVGETNIGNTPTLVVDIGYKGVDLCLLSNKRILYSQSIATGSDLLTKALASTFNLSYQQAEQLKCKVGLSLNPEDEKVFRSMSPIMHIIVNEIAKLINYFKLNFKNLAPQTLLLLGEGSRINGLAEYFNDNLQIKSQVYDAVAKIQMVDKVKKQGIDSTIGYGVAVGLALKRE